MAFRRRLEPSSLADAIADARRSFRHWHPHASGQNTEVRLVARLVARPFRRSIRVPFPRNKEGGNHKGKGKGRGGARSARRRRDGLPPQHDRSLFLIEHAAYGLMAGTVDRRRRVLPGYRFLRPCKRPFPNGRIDRLSGRQVPLARCPACHPLVGSHWPRPQKDFSPPPSLCGRAAPDFCEYFEIRGFRLGCSRRAASEHQ